MPVDSLSVVPGGIIADRKVLIEIFYISLNNEYEALVSMIRD